MKKMKLVFILALVGLFIGSCSKDKDKDIDALGTWYGISLPKEVKTNNTLATKAIQDDIKKFSDYLIFTSDGKVTDSDKSVGSYSVSGNILTINMNGVPGRVTLNGNTFSYDEDETSLYADEISYLLPDETDVVVEKVLTTYTYTKK